MLKPFLSNALLLSLAIATPAFAIDCQTLDKNLATALATAEQFSSYSGSYDEEKLSKANEQIIDILNKLGEDKASIDCPFTQSQEWLSVLTSPDKKFRAFSWDDNSGGTMHFYNQYLQFIDKNRHTHLQTNDNQEFVNSLFTMTINNKPLYLLTTTGIYSTKDTAEILQLYQIQGDKLISPKLIKTQQGAMDKLKVSYNFFSVVDRLERPIKLFKFDEKTKTIRFPVVIEDKEFDNGKVTNRFIHYQFDGKYFVKK